MVTIRTVWLFSSGAWGLFFFFLLERWQNDGVTWRILVNSKNASDAFFVLQWAAVYFTLLQSTVKYSTKDGGFQVSSTVFFGVWCAFCLQSGGHAVLSPFNRANCVDSNGSSSRAKIEKLLIGDGRLWQMVFSYDRWDAVTLQTFAVQYLYGDRSYCSCFRPFQTILGLKTRRESDDHI